MRIHRILSFAALLLLQSLILNAQSVSLVWDASIPGSSGVVTSYGVYRNTVQSSVGTTKIADVTGTNYTDTTVVVGMTYFYAVDACCGNDANGNPIRSAVSNTVSVTVQPIPIPPVTGWTSCAVENQQCAFTGTKEVQYGATGSYITKTITDGTPCTNAVFGDPIFGVTKYCYYRDLTTPPQPPTNLRIVFAAPAANSTQGFKTIVPVILTGSTNAVRVQFFVNGNLKATNPQSSWSGSWFTDKKGNNTLRGTAYDVANQSVSTEIRVQVR